jgi:hypothetical protein
MKEVTDMLTALNLMCNQPDFCIVLIILLLHILSKLQVCISGSSACCVYKKEMGPFFIMKHKLNLTDLPGLQLS